VTVTPTSGNVWLDVSAASWLRVSTTFSGQKNNSILHFVANISRYFTPIETQPNCDFRVTFTYLIVFVDKKGSLRNLAGCVRTCVILIEDTCLEHL
jgi:hypothetical protein